MPLPPEADPTAARELADATLTEPKPRLAGDSPKSRRTRARILECAVRMFVEKGYADAVSPLIAEAAGLTRGAMLYHFPTRESLVEAVIDHLQRERGRLFEEAVAAAPSGADRTDHAVDSYWRLLHEPAFLAFAELEQAARTDAMLAARLAPAQAAFDRGQVGAGMFGFVQAGDAPRFQASRDLARFMLEGLSRARLDYDGRQRTERLLAIVKRAARMLNRKGDEDRLWTDD